MNKWMSRALVGAAGVVTVAAAALAAGLGLAELKLRRQVEVPMHAIVIPAGAVALERGAYLYNSRGCAACHGADGAGRAFIETERLQVRAPNISPGPGNVVAAYRPEDWERAIRHGVKPNGRPLFIMPSEDYNRLTDADLGALVAYVTKLPPATGGGLSARLPIEVRIAYGFGIVTDAAHKIDHRRPVQQPVPEGVTPEHGAYVAAVCTGCHGGGLGGGKIPGVPPSWPAAANLTPGDGSVLPRYPDEQSFVTMMRSGVRPDGSTVSREMPFTTFRTMSDVDLRATYVYLKSLPGRRFGER